mmetsp:Transcript_52655/g.140116  ORF Transcript_52655/g.140116 Transcript_52655/m.140116 type:complete len:768 (+) Transcript_52655:68-2371(+)
MALAPSLPPAPPPLSPPAIPGGCECSDENQGMYIFPLPFENCDWPTALHVIYYTFWMIYFFYAVSLVSNVFMESIEVITAKQKTVKNPNTGEEQVINVWNPTVANLTLMALGSSAPEILLNVVEILTGSFYAGSLGPSTIVGSAAFNLCVITAVCIICLPDGEVRQLEQLGVFLTTSAYSVFAYIWLLIIVMIWTPNIITVTEAVMTIVFLGLLVLQAFLMDKYAGTGALANDYVTRVMDSGDEVIDPEEAAAKIEKLKATGVNVHTKMEATRIAKFLKPKSRAHYRANALKSMAASFKKKGADAAKEGGASPTETSTEMVEVKVGGGRFKKKSSSKSNSNKPLPETKEQQQARREKIKAPHGLLAWRDDVVSVWENCGKVTLYIDRIGGTEGEVTVEYTTKEQTATADADYVSAKGTLTFAEGESSQSIEITIIDDDAFEKDEEFTVVLTEPTGGAVFDADTDGQADKDICTVVILNDDEATGKLSEALGLVQLFNRDNLRLARANYVAQIKEAFDPGESPSVIEIVYFFFNVPWRFLFALVPPPALWGGWPCFVASLMGIGGQVVLINDFASQMGCQMYIKPSVTAITFVALGTSLPDTFASKSAAEKEPYADNSIGNVTGSNSVNVFFGLGVPWTIAAIYWSSGEPTAEWRAKYPKQAQLSWDDGGCYPDACFVVLSEDLGFSVTVFTCCACLTIALILVRRYVGSPPGELGGNKSFARLCAMMLVGLWVLYILLSALSSYGYINVMQEGEYVQPPSPPVSPAR